VREAAQAHDLILTCGGVSVGEEDHVKPAVEAEGRLSMWQIAMKPGKPSRSARCAVPRSRQTRLPQPQPKPSSSVCRAIRFPASRPFCCSSARSSASGRHADGGAARAVAARGFHAEEGRPPQRIPARAHQSAGGLDLFPNQSSAVLTSTVWGDGLIDNPPNHAISAGETVRFIPFSELLN
jgi:Molybdopterin biosynthesis enzyme